MATEFYSKFRSHRIVLRPQRYRMDGFGGRELMPGLQAQFIDHLFSTDDETLIEGLRKHKDYGIDFYIKGEKAAASDEGVAALDDDQAGVENIVNACPHCTFKAKSNLGLKSHIRAQHPDK